MSKNLTREQMCALGPKGKLLFTTAQCAHTLLASLCAYTTLAKKETFNSEWPEWPKWQVEFHLHNNPPIRILMDVYRGYVTSQYFVTLNGSHFFEIFIVSGRMSMVSASTRMYKKKPGMVVYARKSTRNARIPWPIIPHSSAKDCWNTKKKYHV